MDEPRSRGVLYPARLPSFTRIAPDAVETSVVVHFWVPEWDIAPGRASRQHVIAYPAANLVVTPEGVAAVGPTTRRSHRDLSGRGWAVGALLRPAAVPAIIGDPVELRDAQAAVDAPELAADVADAMSRGGEARAERASRILGEWIVRRTGEPGPDALLANELARLVDADPEVLHPRDLAARLGVSERTVSRLARRYVGISPAAMIRRRRLQEAAERLRADPAVPLAELAAELGYADQAHLSRDFRAVLGFTPSGYRARASRPADAAIAQPPRGDGL